MTRRSLLTSLFVLIATASLAAPPPVNSADAAAFMNQLWNRAVEVLNNKADPPVREARFRQLFHEDFDPRYCPVCSRPLLAKSKRGGAAGVCQALRRLRRVRIYGSVRQFLAAKPSRSAAAEATVTGLSSRLTSSAQAAPHRSGSTGGWLPTTAVIRSTMSSSRVSA